MAYNYLAFYSALGFCRAYPFRNIFVCRDRPESECYQAGEDCLGRIVIPRRWEAAEVQPSAIAGRSSRDKIFDGKLQVLCGCLRAWRGGGAMMVGGSKTKRSPNFNIKRASWLPGILKRQKFKWTSLPVIRRPESLWKMSYGYFWRTKCSVSPQGKPWIARVGITWKEGLADVLGTCHWRSVFCSQCHRSPSEETVQKDSCICESFCEKLTNVCYQGEKDSVRK